MYLGKKPSLDDDGLKESQQQSIQAIFEVLEQSGAEESTQSPVLTALHLVVSALEGKKNPQCRKEETELLYLLLFFTLFINFIFQSYQMIVFLF